MADRALPADAAVESGLLGAMILGATERVVDIVEPDDFTTSANAVIFDAMRRLWLSGDAIDTNTVADFLAREKTLDLVGGARRLVDLHTDAPAQSKAPAYARIVVEHAARRRIIAACNDAADAAYNLADPAELVDLATTALRQVDLPIERVPDDLWRLDDFRAQPHKSSAWVIEGCLRQGQRAVLVGGEGAGKSLILQQLAMCVAAGLHPFRLKPTPPVTSLLVDLENDAERINDGTGMVDAALAKSGDVWLWSKPGGIDLRKRRDRTALEAVLRHARPQLVCLGPVYKAYNATASESHELVARELQQVLDDLRTRYSFALVLEHHAPKGNSGERDMTPYGSSYWLRWSEYGIALKRDMKNKGSLRFDRWRGDRVKNQWPDRLDRGRPGEMPWVGAWEDRNNDETRTREGT